MKNERKLFVEGPGQDLSLFQRSYLLSHDDDSSTLIVKIADSFASYRLSDRADEVFSKWVQDQKEFHMTCYLEGEETKFPPSLRYEIFKAHMHNSLLAFMMAEEDLTEEARTFSVIVHYISTNPSYNKIEYPGTIEELAFQDGTLKEFNEGFDYSQLKKSKD